MTKATCSYCDDEAKGLDEEGMFTCGEEHSCMPVVEPMPRVVEVSGDDFGDDNEEEE